MAMASRPPQFGMVAGEASGDLLASLLVGGMQARWPALGCFGIGGPKLAERGFDAWWPSDKLAVRGYVEVLRHYREITGIRKALKARLLAEPPDLFIGVDAPDFNLDLERDLKQQGIKTVHFVCPSVWAWRAERVHKIRQSTDHVLCIFPFEVDLLAQAGVAATFVGHPLAGVIPLEPDKAAARQSLGLLDSDLVLAVLPGSRKSEAQYLASRFFEAAALVKHAQPAIKIVVPAIPALKPAILEAVAGAGLAGQVQVLDGQSHAALAACDVTLIASGTATLEAALFKRPMVIAYKISALSWPLMKRMAYLPWVGLPNILLQDFVVPERLQHDANPAQLAADVLAWLDQPARMLSVHQRFLELHHTLRRDTARAASDAIAQVLESR